MKVKLTYFKDSGKYYTHGEYDTELTTHTALFRVWQEVHDKWSKGELPGLTRGSRLVTLISVPDHPHDHPHVVGLSWDPSRRAAF